MICQWGCIVNAVIDVPIVGQSYHLTDWAVDCQRTLNLYPQVVESGNAPQVAALMPTPGLVERFSLSGRVRGMYAVSNRLFVVAGEHLYLINLNNNVRSLGQISGINQVYMADNAVELMIVSNKAYKLTLSTLTLSEIEPTSYMGASDVTHLDSRFIWTVPSSGKIQWSKLLSTETDALMYATAEFKSDNLVRTVANNGLLWLIGEKTTEVWTSTGNADLPFQRMSGATSPVGCVAKDSIKTVGSGLIWLSQSEHGQGQIVMTQGYQVQRISNHAIESQINSYKKIEDAYAFAYQENGHAFYVISFPSAEKTWCFDLSTGLWHERSYYNMQTAKHEHHRALTHCFFNGRHLIGDRQSGKVYELTQDSQTDDGAAIIRERVTPVLNPHGARLIFDELEIKMQVGQNSNIKPQIMLDWSDDGGRTWSMTRQQDFGAIGEFDKRVIFRRLGQSFNRVFRLRMSDAARLVVLGAKAKVR